MPYSTSEYVPELSVGIVLLIQLVALVLDIALLAPPTATKIPLPYVNDVKSVFPVLPPATHAVVPAIPADVV